MLAPSPDQSLLLILGNQLFPNQLLPSKQAQHVFMAEDYGLCTYTQHHKLKIVLFLAAMRSYADELEKAGYCVHYQKLTDQTAHTKALSYEEKLSQHLDENSGLTQIIHFEIEDKFFEKRIHDFCIKRGLKRTQLASPMFLTTREQFTQYLEKNNPQPSRKPPNKPLHKPLMANFYQQQRKRLNLLIDNQGKPTGGQWSFDADNRKKLPKKIHIPATTYAKPTQHVSDIVELVNSYFPDHPGHIKSTQDVWFPTTRKQALIWLRHFLDKRFCLFGDYEDAISTRGDWLFHSVLSPVMNLGLITPAEIVDRTIKHTEQHNIPINAVEGFIRQVIGWREFIRGIYQHYSDQQEQTNHFHHTRNMKPCWTTGNTGIPPLDVAIRKALRLGWTHHIERLMVLSNFMNLCEIHPKQAHDWFMNMFVDSSDWVMGPNVYGMGLCSDGGIFSTKPYICGSNYLLKMSDYSKGPWCDIADGLYWRFIDRNRDFFASNSRMSVMPRSLDKLKRERRELIFNAAQVFIDEVTQ